MKVNFTDAMLEIMIKEQVKERINQYFAEQSKGNPHWILDVCKDCVRHEVQNIVTCDFVQDACKELSQNNIAEKVVDSFAEKIAGCFEY